MPDLARHSQPLAHADPLFYGKAQLLVKRDDALIRGPYLEIDFCAADVSQSFFRLKHEGSAEAFPTLCCRHGDQMDPASMSVKSSHDRGDDLSIQVAYKKQVALDCQFEVDICLRNVPRRIVGEDLAPKLDHLFFI